MLKFNLRNLIILALEFSYCDVNAINPSAPSSSVCLCLLFVVYRRRRPLLLFVDCVVQPFPFRHLAALVAVVVAVAVAGLGSAVITISHYCRNNA